MGREEAVMEVALMTDLPDPLQFQHQKLQCIYLLLDPE